MKEVKFHSNFASVTVCVGGTPIALHGEVDVVLKKPAKLNSQDEKAWAMLKSGTESINVHGVPTNEA